MNILKKLPIDFFGLPVTLNIAGREKAISKHGIFLSFLLIGYMLWILYTTGRELIIKRNPSITTSETFVENPPKVVFSPDIFPITLQLSSSDDTGLVSIMDESVYHISAKQIIFKTIYLDAGNTTSEDLSIDLDMEICTLDSLRDFQSSFSALPLDTQHCLSRNQSNINQISLQGTEASPYFSGLGFTLVRCLNSSDSPIICAPEDEIQAALANAWLTIGYTQLIIDPENTANPGSRFGKTTYSLLDANSYKTTYFEMSKVDVISDLGWIVEDKHSQSYLRVDSVDTQISLSASPTGEIWTGLFELGQVQTRYERSYTKLQNVLAEIQGLANPAILAIIILTRAYSNMKLKEYLINRIFDVKIKKRITKVKKDKQQKVKSSNSIQTNTVKQKQLDNLQDNSSPTIMNQGIKKVQPENNDKKSLKSYFDSQKSKDNNLISVKYTLNPKDNTENHNFISHIKSKPDEISLKKYLDIFT